MNFPSRYGPWAVVTGASSGIGREFALELARRGMNLILIARRLDRLETVGQECETLGVKSRVCVADLSKQDKVYGLDDVFAEYEIGMLVNSAGVVAQSALHELDRSRLHDLLYLNSIAPVMLAHRVLPGMIERERGAVVFISSTSAHYFHPHMAPYAASKSVSEYIGHHLSWELKGTGVDTLTVTPGATDTDLFEAAEMQVTNETLPPGYRLQSPKIVVKKSFKALGKKESIIVTGFAERLIMRLNSVLPKKLMRSIIAAAAGDTPGADKV